MVKNRRSAGPGKKKSVSGRASEGTRRERKTTSPTPHLAWSSVGSSLGISRAGLLVRALSGWEATFLHTKVNSKQSCLCVRFALNFADHPAPSRAGGADSIVRPSAHSPGYRHGDAAMGFQTFAPGVPSRAGTHRPMGLQIGRTNSKAASALDPISSHLALSIRSSKRPK